MQSGLQTDICVLDFVKAFDKVSHIHLIHKLRWYGITGEVNRWINNFLCDRTQRVVSSVGTRVGKLPTHFRDHPGSGSHCRAGPFCEIQATGILPRPDMSVMMT